MNNFLKGALLAGGALVALKGIDSRLEITYENVVSPSLPEEFDGCRIVHISDYHNDTIPNLVSEIKDICPDYIVCTGDMADDKGSYYPAVALAEKLVGRRV